MTTTTVEQPITLPAEIKTDLQTLANQCPSLIQSDEDYRKAQTWLVDFTAQRKAVENHFAPHIKRAKDNVKALQDDMKRHLEHITPKETALRGMVGTYHAQQAEARRKEQAKLNQQHAKRVERAVEKGKDITEVAPPRFVAPMAKTTKVQDGHVQFREVQKVKILDETKIPDTYYDRTLNRKRLDAAVKAGIPVPGTALVIEEEIAVKV